MLKYDAKFSYILLPFCASKPKSFVVWIFNSSPVQHFLLNSLMTGVLVLSVHSFYHVVMISNMFWQSFFNISYHTLQYISNIIQGSDDLGIGEAFLLIPSFSWKLRRRLFFVTCQPRVEANPFAKPAPTWGEPAGSWSMTWGLWGATKSHILILVYICYCYYYHYDDYYYHPYLTLDLSYIYTEDS